MQSLPIYSPETAKQSALKIKTFTFGCKVNRADTATIESFFFQKEGSSFVSEEEGPNLFVVNTCTVTASADKQAKQLIRKLHREHPKAKIVVTGCSAEANSEKFQKMEGVSSVVPIREQTQIPTLFGIDVSEEYSKNYKVKGRTRGLLKMQDGCNAYCSFCILPYIRGRSRSIPLEQIVSEAENFSKNGFHEVVITGTHIGAYGRDLNPRIRFSDALKKIADAIPHIKIRVSSAEPTTLTKDFISLMREYGQFQPHFHIPLQSGSDVVLRKMNRKYTLRSYAEKVEGLSKTSQMVGIGTDVIVGFPGETDEEFEKTYHYLMDSPITFLHVFRFSPRPGTKADSMKDTIPDQIKYNRMRRLMELGETKKIEFYKKFIETTQTVLIEQKRDTKGRLTGYTPHYIPVRCEGADRLMMRPVEVALKRLEGDVVVGEVI